MNIQYIFLSVGADDVTCLTGPATGANGVIGSTDVAGFPGVGANGFTSYVLQELLALLVSLDSQLLEQLEQLTLLVYMDSVLELLALPNVKVCLPFIFYIK